ncbi:MAG: hypothetical protein NZ932_03840 [Candidatus Bathyarchaeota archaeon]|nr:hypothetical protein [Candidatus Bathyarchaeota archaeon]MDW8022400.1 hypothetical protein [Nitrososphaerota archaeon]
MDKLALALLVAAGYIMILLVFLLPDIDYDSYFRFQLAYNIGFSVRYAHSLIWLPVYQFVIAFVRNFLWMRLFSVVCVLLAGVVLARWGLNEDVAVATSVFFLLNPFILLYGSQAMSESLNVLLTVVFIWLFMREKHVYAAFVLACGVLTAYSFWVFIPFVLGYVVFERKRECVAYLLAVFAVVWWGYVNYLFAGKPLNFIEKASVFYNALKNRILWGDGWFSFLLFPFIYPFMFVAPFSVKVFSGKLTSMDVKGKWLLLYFVVAYTVLLVVGQVFGYIFSWGRYFIPLIPVYLLLGCEPVVKSRRKKVWVMLYFVFSTVMTVFEAVRVYDFKWRMYSD